jgi:hypothetical protein
LPQPAWAASQNGYAILAVTQDSGMNLAVEVYETESELSRAGNTLIEFRGVITNTGANSYEVAGDAFVNRVLRYQGGANDIISVAKSGNSVIISTEGGYLSWNNIPLTPLPPLLPGFTITLDNTKKYRAERGGAGDADVEIKTLVTGKTNILFIDVELKAIKLHKDTVSLGGMVKLGSAMKLLESTASASLTLNELLLDNNHTIGVPPMDVEGKIELNPGKLLGLVGQIKSKGAAEFKLNSLPGIVKTFAVKGELDIQEIFYTDGEFGLAWREWNGQTVIVPDTLTFFVRLGKVGVPLVPPAVVAYITGLGGGFSGMGQTILGNWPQVPPFKIKTFGAIQDSLSGSIIDIKKATQTVGPSELSLYANEATVLKFLNFKEVGGGYGLMESKKGPIPAVYQKAGGKLELINIFKGEANFRTELDVNNLAGDVQDSFKRAADHGFAPDLRMLTRMFDAVSFKGDAKIGVELDFGYLGKASGELRGSLSKTAVTGSGTIKIIPPILREFYTPVSFEYILAKKQFKITVLGVDFYYPPFTGATKVREDFLMYKADANGKIMIPDMKPGDLVVLYSKNKPASIKLYSGRVVQLPLTAKWVDDVSDVPGYEDGSLSATLFLVPEGGAGTWAFEASGLLDSMLLRPNAIPSFTKVTANVVGQGLNVSWELDGTAVAANSKGDLRVGMLLVDAGTNEIVDNMTEVNASPGSYNAAFSSTLPSGNYYVSARLFNMMNLDDMPDPIENALDIKDSGVFTYTNPLAPGTPGRVLAEYAGNGSFTLRWSPVSGADGYIVTALSENGAPLDGIGHVNVENGTEVTLNGGVVTFRPGDPDDPGVMETSVLEYGKPYQFKIQAYRLKTLGNGTETYSIPVYGPAGMMKYTIPEPAVPVVSIAVDGTRIEQLDKSGNIITSATATNNREPMIVVTSDVNADIIVYLGEERIGSMAATKSFSFPYNFGEDGMYALRAEASNGKDSGGAGLNLVINTKPPFMNVNEEEYIAWDGKIRVAGFAEAGATLFVNGEPIKFEGGVFFIEREADGAVSNIDIKAVDAAGNATTRTLTILSSGGGGCNSAVWGYGTTQGVFSSGFAGIHLMLGVLAVVWAMRRR